ncbi:unnamed protein product [Moneuplotes crassus]|uniref:Uncharacterized protein n=1 Tax=Euplotes crassus TaxID=5936 RepID=A0AAD1XIV4_EUPCR|nr:unnamed protein product [Moneuplotes crassus]|eukprot:CAMPEP_0196996268 /NCGR_PEP_ID=MMETSP1380-20130617/2185_1 /TAXON_ID=5936 /ORGANISM="Euplotes crassus, Strain CT5" /LENGTH=315 /DNA_ID=CAMNT_0042412171 /DNA_START=21 /DNA_END=968 /DNA_ORIENTATION=-
MKAIAIISLISALGLLYVAYSPAELSYDAEFEQFISTYGKNYASQTEMEYRKAIFEDNMKKADELNKLNPEAEFGVTIFADQTGEEMLQRMGAVDSGNDDSDGDVYTETSDSLSKIDWRSKMKSIQDQGSCGSCWAFSATAAFEGRYQVKKGSISKLSEQEALDCSSSSYGCNGGWYDAVWNYMKSHKFCTQGSYKYTGRKGSCRSSSCSGTQNDKGYTSVSKSESSMHSALGGGPISIAVDASTWSTYRQGVMTSSQCGRNMNHAVVLVGYNPTDNAWIVRNSWGSNWGESGHIRLKYGQNTCDITYKPQYPNF